MTTPSEESGPQQKSSSIHQQNPEPGGKPMPCVLPEENDLPQEGSIRNVLFDLEAKLREAKEKEPNSEATKQLEKDLTDTEKEYGSFSDICKKYETAYEQFCTDENEAKSQLEEIVNWSKVVSKDEQSKIDGLWDKYEKRRKTRECDWIKARENWKSLKTCLDQAKDMEQETTDDFNQVKDFEKLVKSRFEDLKSLHKTAKGYFDAEQYGSVYAVRKEYENVKGDLWELETWKERIAKCMETCPTESSKTQEDWKPEEFKQNLIDAFRIIINSKYERYIWLKDWINKDKEKKDTKDFLDSFNQGRRTKFFQEAEESKPVKDSRAA
jgi:hypothetical protein